MQGCWEKNTRKANTQPANPAAPSQNTSTPHKDFLRQSPYMESSKVTAKQNQAQKLGESPPPRDFSITKALTSNPSWDTSGRCCPVVSVICAWDKSSCKRKGTNCIARRLMGLSHAVIHIALHGFFHLVPRTGGAVVVEEVIAVDAVLRAIVLFQQVHKAHFFGLGQVEDLLTDIPSGVVIGIGEIIGAVLVQSVVRLSKGEA